MSIRAGRMNRTAIRALAPGEKITEGGVIATRLANGDTRYSVNIQVDGERIHRVVGLESEGTTHHQARMAIEKWKTEARTGRLDLPKGRKLHRSFSEGSAEYMQRLKETGGKNILIKERHFKQRLDPYFGNTRIDQIKDFAVLHYVRERLVAGATQATVNRELATLSNYLRCAVNWKWMRSDRLPEIQLGPEPRKSITVLSEVQCNDLMLAAKQDQDQRLWLFVMFGLNAAMRHSEILRARYERIDFERRRLFIPEAKAGERDQPLTQALVDVLISQRRMETDKQGWIFPTVLKGQSKAGRRTNMARPFARAVIRAGLDPDKVTPHTMRHTAITRLVQAGVDLPTIQRISGHKTLAMVLRYTHVEDTHLDAAIDRLGQQFSGMSSHELHVGAQGINPTTGAVVSISSGKTRC
ncbi:tyrosine-type recombinase/integrase [Sphingomonas sp.]|uniref:tyrosine-type recombinase/integrase n=1 Tax=Sphingomonas sp. TaxID=28214 RepID=UPI0037532D3E